MEVFVVLRYYNEYGDCACSPERASIVDVFKTIEEANEEARRTEKTTNTNYCEVEGFYIKDD